MTNEEARRLANEEILREGSRRACRNTLEAWGMLGQVVPVDVRKRLLASYDLDAAEVFDEMGIPK